PFPTRRSSDLADAGDIRDLERFHVDFHLLDARPARAQGPSLRGGTGETFDWSLVRGRRSDVPLIVSGGLNAQNVGEAIAISRPYAVDTASGTEAAPGRKDERRLRAFFAAARAPSGIAQPA